ncbi:oxidative stress-responsive serine-rich protein 1-like [Heteronotia binoei]|uniref:oxidative stress-responsive serine-rich protein 1-like n=1 Tax=Heteronotia binoei TaxID=13085 RepID=UPI002930740A|nr:oxidative stress-responsive serine-rich protein 1-like [Heteronotia binoei]XP_060086851.1 oxidative stress-responsive serine-rich protein 1-like [Heteronotia binoei]XP_060086853.1 oxidative stress-responsive serine-rich protein 1-like [Heteronotia binoei]
MLEIEENLQAAFKKLRVDAEGSTATLPLNESASLRPLVRTTDETKPKNMGASKESWHCCLRKPLRGTARTRRRRSKSPILHPPKFIHCNTQTSSCSQPASKNSTKPSESSSGTDMPASKEFSKIEQSGHLLNEVDPRPDGVEESGAPTVETLKNKPEGGAVSLPTTILKVTDLADFQSLSDQSKGNLCACTDKTCQCQQWQDMKVYMFSDLQSSLPSAPERTTHVQDNLQALPSRTPSSSLRSCSEQARANVDDVTIEDLSGYMEYFLHIPKKMSHMAEMMYT